MGWIGHSVDIEELRACLDRGELSKQLTVRLLSVGKLEVTCGFEDDFEREHGLVDFLAVLCVRADVGARFCYAYA